MKIDTKEKDLQLFKRIQTGDEGAFSFIFNNYYEPLYRFAARFVRESDISEEVVQEVFVKIWVNRSRINITYDLKTYLYTAVKNHCLNLLKQKKRISYIDEDTEKLTSVEESSEDDYEKDEKINEIRKAINKLPEKCRRIFVMKKYDGLSYKEISDILDISINTVKTQMTRALKSLIKQLNHLRTIIILLIL